MLCWALLCINFSASKAQVLDPTQTYTTGNVVLPTISGSGTTPWVNGIYQDSLTCWAWGNPGYCGPNPIVRPDNLINFSFGWTDLYQSQAIASLLPGSGTGLRVDGFNFGFMAKNGNGWDDGRIDNLGAYVNFYDTKNTAVKSYVYDLNYKFDWTSFNFSETFSSPLATNQLSNVRYGFVGSDNNFWAGPYGPEIMNVSFSLRYSVDPCFVNVLSSPSCPGYLEALAKLQPPPSASIAAVVDTSTPSSSTPSEPVAQQIASQPTVTVGATVSLSQPLATTTNTTSNSNASSSPSLGTILSIVRREQSRISTIESTTVQQANETASQLTTQAQQQAEKTAAVATQTSIQQSTSNTTGSTGNMQSQQSLGTGLVASVQNSIGNIDTISFVGVSPLRDQIESVSRDLQGGTDNNQTQRSGEVKKNVKDNEAAGGISIAALSTQPPGYELYQLGMKDAPFYAPKEIYKNQKVIDNERVLRQLNGRSDRLHEEMVNGQYR